MPTLLVGLARNAVLERQGQAWMDEAQARYEATAGKQRLFSEFSYAANTWDRERRVIAKAEFGPQGDNPRFVEVPADSRPLRRAQPGAARGGKGVLCADVALPAFVAARPAYSRPRRAVAYHS